jgi:hypothetical protein
MMSAACVRTLGLLLLAGLAACDDGKPAETQDIRPVRVMAVENRAGGEIVSLTGTVQAETEVNLAFRIDGRVIERLVNVGDAVWPTSWSPGWTATTRRNGVRAARAAVVTAQSALVEARNNYDRQRQLLRSGFTTRVRYDEATRTCGRRNPRRIPCRRS